MHAPLGDARLAQQPAIDAVRRATAVADRDRDGALGRHHVAAGEDPRVPGHQVLVDLDDAVLLLDPGDALEQ